MKMSVVNVMMGLLVAVVFGMTGCGGGSSSTQTPSASTASTATSSAKSFTTEGGTVTFNANGTLSSVGFDTSNQTWAVNSSGQLVIYGTSKGTATITLSGDATNGWSGNMAYANGTTETLKLTPVVATVVTGNVFTTAMINGKTFNFTSSDSDGTLTFNSDHSLYATHSPASGGGTSGGTWSINSSGQLITTFIADSGTYTSTLTSTTATTIVAAQTWTKPSGNGSGTMTFTTGSTASPITPNVTNRYIVSGTITNNGVGLAGVTLRDGVSMYTATTDNNGNFSFNTTSNGSSTITPSKNGYTFSPASLPVTVNGANVTGLNYTATPAAIITYSVTGKITSGANGIAGVTVSAGTGGGSAITDANGNYTISGMDNGIYTLTPSKVDYTFSPSNLVVSVYGANLTGYNFAARVIRFIDKGNGTIYDKISNLTWLKNSVCFGTQTWDSAIAKSNALSSGQCGLSDGSTAGNWHLPTVDELRIFVDAGYTNMTLQTSGFSSVNQGGYWSSTLYASSTSNYWVVSMGDGYTYNTIKTNSYYVWPVRVGQ
jgi:hypothetical protein